MTKPRQQGSLAALSVVWIELAGNFCRLLVVFALIPALAGGYVFLSQLALWLKSAIWVPLPLLYLFTDFWPLVGERFTPDQLEKISASGGGFPGPLSLISHFRLDTQFPGVAAWLAEPGTWGDIHKITRWVLESLPISLVLIVLTLFMASLLMLCSVTAKNKVRRLDSGINTDDSADAV
jgi:hypothetical protein